MNPAHHGLPDRSIYSVSYEIVVNLRDSGFLITDDMEFNLAALSAYLHRCASFCCIITLLWLNNRRRYLCRQKTLPRASLIL